MPIPDLERADRAARAASKLVARKLPDGYPTSPPPHLEAHVHSELRRRRLGLGDNTGPEPVWSLSRAPRERHVLEALVAGGAAELLERALAVEAQAREAQALAIEALRFAQPHAYPWSKIGELAGVSAQGAFKRWRHVEEQEAQARLEEHPDLELQRRDAAASAARKVDAIHGPPRLGTIADAGPGTL